MHVLSLRESRLCFRPARYELFSETVRCQTAPQGDRASDVASITDRDTLHAFFEGVQELLGCMRLNGLDPNQAEMEQAIIGIRSRYSAYRSSFVPSSSRMLLEASQQSLS